MRAIAVFLASFSVAACGGLISREEDGGSPSDNTPQHSSGGATAGSSSGGLAMGSAIGGSGGSSAGGSSGPASPATGPSSPGFVGADAGSALSTVVDAARPLARDAAPVRCNMTGPGAGGGGGGGSGPGSCSAFGLETCSGISYSVSCSCPQGSCACIGASTSIIAFAGCPACPNLPQLFALCGFPQ